MIGGDHGLLGFLTTREAVCSPLLVSTYYTRLTNQETLLKRCLEVETSHQATTSNTPQPPDPLGTRGKAIVPQDFDDARQWPRWPASADDCKHRHYYCITDAGLNVVDHISRRQLTTRGYDVTFHEDVPCIRNTTATLPHKLHERRNPVT